MNWKLSSVDDRSSSMAGDGSPRDESVAIAPDREGLCVHGRLLLGPTE